MGRIRPVLAVTACVLLTGACGHTETTAKNTTPSVPTTSPAPVIAATKTIAPTTSTIPVEPAALPLCGDVKGSGSAGAAPADCKLISHDSAGFSFIVRHRDGFKFGTQARIDVTGGDGTVLQTIDTDDSDAPGVEPFLADLVGDGRDELIVPLSLAIVGNGNFEVFRPKANKPEFARSGTVFGIGVDRSAGGYIVGQSKGGAAHWYIEFDRFQGSQLVFVAEIINSSDTNGHWTCAVDNEQGSLQSELSDDEIIQRFCGREILRTAPVH
ncbi:hypothetical protein ACIP5Y_30680 [Nocardia sp. NPDC088792]|uniref:hypothetical protein n=1 Tax=Nocardia sp. NPDC088792 TaxID=3364332 RepID=UPI00382AB35F